MNIFLNYLRKIPPGIFFLFVLLISIAWMSFWSLTFWGESYYSMDKVELVVEIAQQPFVAIGEEFLFRFIPFMIATIVWFVAVKLKVPKKSMIVFLAIPMILIQIEFGLLHCLWDHDLRAILELPPEPDISEKMQHVILQGGMGIIISLTYLRYLLDSKGIWKYIQIIPLFLVPLLHMLSNQIILIMLNWNYKKAGFFSQLFFI